ncbi:MAG TPA: hypothetical protein VFI65_13835 [Streptosporangiaceae bacterium]|nr:hypothetical protein [Streptosporangiaceae bacterium]
MTWSFRSSPAALACAVTGLLLTGFAGPPAARAAGSRAAAAPCNESALQKALDRGGTLVFKASCTLNLTKALTVPAGDDVTLNGNGHAVAINGGSASYQPLSVITRVFVVAGTLKLKSLTVAHGEAVGTAARNGNDGAAGRTGTTPGEDGGPGEPGKLGGNGGDGQGGGIFVKHGATVTVDHVNFTGDIAFGAPGGAGGIGGSGGQGGPAKGGTAGSGGEGADGGNAGDAGNGQGGAIYNLGTLTVIGGTFSDDQAIGGAGGLGGPGGHGGAGGEIQTSGAFGNGGKAANGGDGGHGGAGEGGAVYSAGSLVIEGSQFANNTALGGNAGIGAPGGDGGSGFCPSGNPTDCGGNFGGHGGNGGDGSDGGNGRGGAVYGTGRVDLAGVGFTDNKVGGGTTGPDCNAPNPGCGGNGGAGGGFATHDGAPGKPGVKGRKGSASFPSANRASTSLPALKVTTSKLARGHKGKRYRVALTAKGGIAPYRWTVKGLPKGLSAASSGVISGKPKSAGVFRLTITVHDPTAAQQTTGTAKLTLTVTKAG